jgi:hypothetical protein
MPARSTCLFSFLLCLGCNTLVPLGPGDSPTPAAEAPSPVAPAPPPAVEARKEVPVSETPAPAEQAQAVTHLGQAATCLEKGDETGALPHLAQYLAVHPDHVVVRAHYAELLLRLNHDADARREFERLAAECPGRSSTHLKQLIHFHSRLMEIAEAENQDYEEHLHRGIGLYLLGRQHAELEDATGEASPESLFCKSAAELTMAHTQHPDRAQPSWYLYEVWSQLNQRQNALRCLREADAAAPFSYLTPAERSALQLACCLHEPVSLRK